MMNKLTIVFCLILCAAFCGNYQTVSAQNGADKILVAGKSPLKQSEVDKIIEFYQWAFETEFTADERERYQAFVVESFRQDAAESRKSADVLIKVLAQMRAKDAETQAKLRRMFNEDFVKDLRAANDEGSRLLLNIYERGQSRGIGSGGGNSSESNETTDSNDSYETVKKAKVGNLSTIAGTWVSGNTGSMTTTNSGVYLGGNASRHTYQFRADGTVEYTGIMNIMTGGCRMQIFKTATGKASLSGDRLTINWLPARFSRDDSCSPSKNYKKTLPAETETFQIFFETYFDDKQLCLAGKDKTCFSLDK